MPFSSKIIVEEEPLLNVIDQMRVSIPEEIKRARRVQQDREKEVSRGSEEAEKIISEAREEAVRLLDEHEIRHAAEVQAQRILERAGTEASSVTSGAIEYAGQVLRQLAEHLSKLDVVVNNGLRSLEEERLRSVATVPEPEPTPHSESRTSSRS